MEAVAEANKLQVVEAVEGVTASYLELVPGEPISLHNVVTVTDEGGGEMQVVTTGEGAGIQVVTTGEGEEAPVITAGEGAGVQVVTSSEGGGTQVVTTGGAADLSVGLNIETQSDNMGDAIT